MTNKDSDEQGEMHATELLLHDDDGGGSNALVGAGGGACPDYRLR